MTTRVPNTNPAYFGSVCTCGCPDGQDQHLVDCEVYLHYWEEEDLKRIGIRYRQIRRAMPRGYGQFIEALDDLVETLTRFVRSTSTNVDIMEPHTVIRRHLSSTSKSKR